MPDSRPEPQRGLIITEPKLPPRVNLVSNGTVTVRGEATEDNAYVRVGVFRPGEVPLEPDLNDPNLIRVPVQNGEFLAVNVPNAVVGSTNVAKAWGYDQYDKRTKDSDERAFTGCDSQVNQTVNATCCLWFAWAPSGTAQPWGEQIDCHRPIRIAVPVGARSVSIVAAGLWRHDPAAACETGPDGRTSASEAEKPEYHNYGADGLQGKDLPLNMLVGAWETVGANGTPTLGEELAIGSNWSSAIPENATSLWLGFHDGFEWNNNEESVQATIVWCP